MMKKSFLYLTFEIVLIIVMGCWLGPHLPKPRNSELIKVIYLEQYMGGIGLVMFLVSLFMSFGLAIRVLIKSSSQQESTVALKQSSNELAITTFMVFIGASLSVWYAMSWLKFPVL